ncbi:hypothetical protein BGW38_005473 [Lunasporangiospora selenospora]|uniref:Dynamin stalk domain-containing protein n=1 Tax=Lunasporangiospora selenospora TaxID=979761 RepID=A0A9P6KHE6_9FUNG|nr:hypothetical protein BGW38_005473 [Lunasporangiospora selenospora]
MRLSTVLYEHISKELPEFKREIGAVVREFKVELEAMGAPIFTYDDAHVKLSQASMILQPQVDAFLRADCDYHYFAKIKDIPISESELDPLVVYASLQKHYSDYRSAMMRECNPLTLEETQRLLSRYKANNLPGFVPFTTFKDVIKGHYLPGLEIITKENVFKMYKHLTDDAVADGSAKR